MLIHTVTKRRSRALNVSIAVRYIQTLTLALTLTLTFTVIDFGYSGHTHTHIRLTALCPGLPGSAGTRKVKTNLDFTKARDSEWQWLQLGHMQVCTSLQTDNPYPATQVFYRPDALPAAHPTASKH